MQQSVFCDIVAKLLVFVDAVLDQFVVGVTYTSGNLLNCVPAEYSGGSLTACGQSLVYRLPLLLTQRVAFHITLGALGID